MVSRNLPASTTLAFLPNSRFGTQEGANAEKQIPGRLSAQVDIRCVQVGTRGRVDGFYKKLSESNGSTITAQFRTIGWNRKKKTDGLQFLNKCQDELTAWAQTADGLAPVLRVLYQLCHYFVSDILRLYVFFFGSGLSLAVIFQRGTLRGDRWSAMSSAPLPNPTLLTWILWDKPTRSHSCLSQRASSSTVD